MNTLQRRKEKREQDPSGGGSAAAGGPSAAAEEAQRPRSMTVSAATRVRLSFSVAGWAPLDLAGGQMLSTGDLAAEGAEPLPAPCSPVFTRLPGRSLCGFRLVEISRAWVGPKQVLVPGPRRVVFPGADED